MPPSKNRYVTACQQLLALGLVVAALTPAAGVVSLDVVREHPATAGGGHGAATRPATGLAAYVRATEQPSTVPAQVVDPEVSEYSLTPAPGARTAPDVLGRRAAGAQGVSRVTSTPEPVLGYGAVGITWEHGVSVPEEDVSFRVRTRTGDTWSGWMPIEYDAEHGPDPDSPEGRHARPGTDALLVGDVDQVQVRAVSTDRTLPADMRLAVIDPGASTRNAVEKPALDTSTMGEGSSTAPVAAPAELATDPGEGTGGSDRIALQRATFTPKPKIYSRAQWGADERMRDKGSLHYYEVHAGFVHHTVNANDYSRAEVPGIIRSIYAYHTRSRGWSDIGYNFLVDRFGRIWEGRYGGVDRPVVGAHTLNYNDYAFAMSAIGNYDVRRPSNAMVQAYGALFAWKLSLHGVNAASKRQWVGSRYFQAINGHRDAASTACPGRYLYARIPEIRRLAAAAQRGWSGRELESDLASSPHPDLIVRRASDGKGFIIPTGGMTGFRRASAPTSLAAGDNVVASPDLTGDGRGDLLVRASNGVAEVRPGNGRGGFGAGIRATRAFAGHDQLTAVGDLNHDGRNDLAGRAGNGRLDVYLGDGHGGFRTDRLRRGWQRYTMLVGAGDVSGDGRPDLLGRDAAGKLWLQRGRANASFGRRTPVPGSWTQYSTITGVGDFTRDGRDDLFARYAKSGRGVIVPSRGNGTFGHPLGSVSRIARMRTLVGVAQMTGNGAPDLVTSRGGAVVVFPNRGTVETRAPIATGMDLSHANLLLNAGDWDRDGFGDIIYRNRMGRLYVRLGDGKGHFAPSRRIGRGFDNVRLLAAVGDMTGDGYPDLMGQPRRGAMRIYPGRGASGLRPSYVAHSAIGAGTQIAVGRWNGDGAPDSLFRSGSRTTLYPGNGPGGLTNPKQLGQSLRSYDWVVGVSDVGLTGHADVIVRDPRTDYLWLLPGTTKGFQGRRFLAEGMGGYNLAG